MLKIIYLGAEWCGPCKKMKPILEEFEQENPEVMIVRIDVDEDPETAVSLDVISIPTLVVMKDNVEIARKRGALSKPGLSELVFGKTDE